LALVGAACTQDPTDAAPTPTAAVVTTAAPTTVAPTESVAPVDSISFPPSDIVGMALVGGDFTQLAGMLVDAGLVDTLRGAGPFTVFAPTNAAFAKLPLSALHGVQDDPKTLATVLTYHVVAGDLKLADLKPGKLTTVAGIDLTVTRQGDKVFVNGVEATGDVVATNGVIHVLGDVLLPPG
jgi:uncharacterized surface protein with fasciclin (FAS1) repeats